MEPREGEMVSVLAWRCRVGLVSLGFSVAGFGLSEVASASAAGWGGVFKVTTPTTQPAGGFEVAADKRGVTSFVWEADKGSKKVVERRRIGSDGKLGAPQALGGAFSGGSGFNFAIDARSGRGAASWGPGNGVQARLLPSDGSLGPLRTVTTGSQVFGLGLGVEGDGTAVPMWSKLGSNTMWQFRELASGGQMGPVRTLKSVPQADLCISAGGDVVPARGGNTFVFWTWSGKQGFDCVTHLSLRRVAPDGSLGPVREVLPPESVADGTGIVSWDAVALPDGGVQVVYNRAVTNSEGGWGTYFLEARKIAPSGEVGAVKRLDAKAPDPSAPYLAVLADPHVDADADGNATVIWKRANPVFGGEDWTVRARRVLVNGGLGPVRVLSGSLHEVNPEVAVDAGGIATAVFSTDDHFQIQGRRVMPGGAGPLKTVGYGSGTPEVAVGGDGVATAFWRGSPIGSDLEAARYDPSP
jgi:hypothetical protein